MRALRATEIGIPRHRWEPGDEDTFALSSHARAREALDLALSIDAPGFNVYVLGEERTGRMSATVAYLSAIRTAAQSARKDWVYLQNFRDARQPLAFGLAVGDGARFSDALHRYVSRLRAMLVAALESDAHRERAKGIYRSVDEQIGESRPRWRGPRRRSGSRSRRAAKGSACGRAAPMCRNGSATATGCRASLTSSSARPGNCARPPMPRHWRSTARPWPA